MKRTIVLGASEDPDRYSQMAIQRLAGKGHDVIAVGLTKGEIFGKKIYTPKDTFIDVDTITMYVGPRNQPFWYDFILSHNPKRIIFNPGAENPELEKMANEKGIETLNACTLVMLSIGNY
jgi:uncharacterized protein